MSLHPSSPDPSIYAPYSDDTHTGAAWASHATAEPWDPAILALDGGGMRGYSSLLILQELMRHIQIWEKKLARQNLEVPALNGHSTSHESNESLNEHDLSGDSECREDGASEQELLPCHYFDFMYGTSTGGLIATMLGRLRMSVPQCLAIYRQVGQDLFGRRRSRVPLRTKYNHKPLERSVRDIIRAHCKQHPAPGECNGQDWFPWNDEPVLAASEADFDSHICQAICLTAVHNGRIDVAYLLRSYDHHYANVPSWIMPYNEGADPLHIWEVTRATSAAPFYFEALEADIRNEKWIFKDGGIRENNPARAAWNEFISMHGEDKDPALLLSIGTGMPNESNDGFANAWPGPFAKSSFMKKAAEKFAVVKNLMIKYTDGEGAHKDLLSTARGEYSWYKRLNVSEGLENMKLDEWVRGPWKNPEGVTEKVPGGKTLTLMEDATRKYVTRGLNIRFDSYAPPKTMISQAAEKLVRQRLARQAARTTNMKRWETYMGHYMDGKYSPQPDGPIEHAV